jgi:hypothetical protein
MSAPMKMMLSIRLMMKLAAPIVGSRQPYTFRQYKKSGQLCSNASVMQHVRRQAEVLVSKSICSSGRIMLTALQV